MGKVSTLTKEVPNSDGKNEEKTLSVEKRKDECEVTTREIGSNKKVTVNRFCEKTQTQRCNRQELIKGAATKDIQRYPSKFKKVQHCPNLVIGVWDSEYPGDIQKDPQSTEHLTKQVRTAILEALIKGECKTLVANTDRSIQFLLWIFPTSICKTKGQMAIHGSQFQR